MGGAASSSLESDSEWISHEQAKVLAKDLYDPAEFAAISDNYKIINDEEDPSYTSSFAAGAAKVKREDYLLYLYEKSIKPFHLTRIKTTMVNVFKSNKTPIILDGNNDDGISPIERYFSYQSNVMLDVQKLHQEMAATKPVPVADIHAGVVREAVLKAMGVRGRFPGGCLLWIKLGNCDLMALQKVVLGSRSCPLQVFHPEKARSPALVETLVREHDKKPRRGDARPLQVGHSFCVVITASHNDTEAARQLLALVQPLKDQLCLLSLRPGPGPKDWVPLPGQYACIGFEVAKYPELAPLLPQTDTGGAAAAAKGGRSRSRGRRRTRAPPRASRGKGGKADAAEEEDTSRPVAKDGFLYYTAVVLSVKGVERDLDNLLNTSKAQCSVKFKDGKRKQYPVSDLSLVTIEKPHLTISPTVKPRRSIQEARITTDRANANSRSESRKGSGKGKGKGKGKSKTKGTGRAKAKSRGRSKSRGREVKGKRKRSSRR